MIKESQNLTKLTRGRYPIPLILFFILYNAVLLFNSSLHSVISVDEPFYINAGNIMLQSGDWLLPRYESGELRLNKPILIYWLVALGQFFAADPIFGSRLVAIIFTNIHLVGIFLLCHQLFGDRKVCLSALWIFAATPQLLQRSHTILPEVLLITLVTWSLFVFWRIRSQKERSPSLLIALYLLLAINFLVKGPPGVILTLVVVISYIAISKEWPLFRRLWYVPGFLIFVAIAFSWHLYLTLSFGSDFMISLFEREILTRLSEVNAPLTFLSIFPLFHPWLLTLVAVISWSLYEKDPFYKKPEILFLVVWMLSLLVFINAAVRELHTHYTLDIVVPVVILTARLFNRKDKFHRLSLTVLLTIGVTLSANYHFNLPDIIFPKTAIAVHLSICFVSLLFLWLLTFHKAKFDLVMPVAISLITLSMIEFHLIREKGNLIHQEEFYEVNSDQPVQVISGNTQIGTYVKFYWSRYDNHATHHIVYSFKEFISRLERSDSNYAFCSEESWELLPPDLKSQWSIIASTYDTKKERFAQSSNITYKNAIRVVGRHFIKYYLIKREK